MYDFDPSWVFEESFRLFHSNKLVSFEHVRDNGATRDLSSGGSGRDLSTTRLRCWRRQTVTPLVFGDATNGSETYPSGRFVLIDGPSARATATAKGGTGKRGVAVAVQAERAVVAAMVVDLNRAFILPPCGFSEHFNCPLPPRQNRLRVAVRAGEKRLRPLL